MSKLLLGGPEKGPAPGLMSFVPRPTQQRQSLVLLAVILLAFALRLVGIEQIPVGLSHDEAYNGITAMQVLDGEYRIFFEINKGIEPLIIYLEALSFHFFGIGPVPLRLVNVLFGLLTVALVYPFAARLLNRRVALLAMTGLAISFWAIFVSRLTLRAVLLPPLLLLTCYLFWRGLVAFAPGAQAAIDNQNAAASKLSRHRLPLSGLVFFSLSGLVAGVTMYTYLSSRFLPLIMITVFAHQLIRRQINKWHWQGLFLFFLVWAVVFLPLGTYFLDNRASFSRRSDQVLTIPQALDGNPVPMLRNTVRTLGMFTFRGDTTDRYNLDGRPVFDWFNGLMFYLGLAITLWRLTRSPKISGPAALLLSMAFFMLLPDLITDDSPHFLRVIGTMPVVYIMWAMGLEFLILRLLKWQRQQRRFNFGTAVRFPTSGNGSTGNRYFRQIPLATALVLLLLTLTTFHTAYDYFFRWAAAPGARHIYGADIAELANYVRSTASEGLTVISAEYYQDLDPFRFTLHFRGQAPFVIWFDGRQSLAFPPADSNLSPRYVFPASAPPADLWSTFLQPSEAGSGSQYTLYHLTSDAPLAQLQDTIEQVGVNVNGDLVLLGYRVLGEVESGGKFQVLLVWQALRALPPGTDYTFLLRMRDNKDLMWLEVDGNGYRPADWQPGVQALQLLTVRLPADLPPRAFRLTLEVVDRRSGLALPTLGGSTVIPLGTIDAQLPDNPRRPAPDQIPNLAVPEPGAAVEASGLKLSGYEVDQRRLKLGSDLHLTLHWHVLSQPQQDYKIHYVLVDDKAEAVYRWPTLEPANGEWPTSQWPADYWVQDKLQLPVSSSVPIGRYMLQAILTAPAESARSAAEKAAVYDLGSVLIEPNDRE
jgi:4-amino-4-deoxy-L-arabinose transferase-like glycosyltransferase